MKACGPSLRERKMKNMKEGVQNDEKLQNFFSANRDTSK